jgi:hypothetical protein
VLLIAIHVDDLKITGPPDAIKWFIEQLVITFGKLIAHFDSFTNCGIRHVRDTTTGMVTLDQHEYAKALKPMTHPDLKPNAESALSSECHSFFLSLLGALAYLSLMRIDVIVFIAELQRYNHAPKVIHAKRLNSAVRWVQRNLIDLRYGHFDQKDNIVFGISDAAFKKEEEEATAMRGCCGSYFNTVFEDDCRLLGGSIA